MDGGAEAPDIDFGRILARLIRYFHQPKEYWLEKGTLQDWIAIYSRELVETPPIDDLVAAYLGYEKPSTVEAVAEIPEAMLLPEFEA